MRKTEIEFLPTMMISKGEINGQKIDYENYLTEIVNFSLFFMRLTNGVKFTRITEQDNGEADVRAKDYDLDFKLLVNQEFVNNKLKSLPDVDYTNLSNGFICVTDKPSTGNTLTQAQANGLFVKFLFALSSLTDTELANIETNKDDNLYGTIKMIKKAKNLLFFLPCEITCDFDNDVVDFVRRFLTRIFVLRDNIDKDTFITIIRKGSIVGDEFYIIQYNRGEFHIVDKVHKFLITTFNDIYRLTAFTENR